MKRTVFAVLGVIAAAPAWARTLDDNPVINSYRQHPGVGGQRHGPETPDDNFMQDTAMREDTDSYLDDQNDQRRRNCGSFYLDETDQDDP